MPNNYDDDDNLEDEDDENLPENLRIHKLNIKSY